MKRTFLTLALALAGTTAAHAQITVDGTLDAAYGSATAVVGQDPNQVYSNFGDPQNTVKDIGYSIYLASGPGYVYGYLQSQGPGTAIATFANLYFDLDPGASNGSDIGFELSPGPTGNHNFFIPGRDPTSSVTGISIAESADGTGIEFSIPNSYFISYQPGFDYYSGHALATIGSDVTLRISQSFGFSAAGGASYGDDRLGSVTLLGVPEPTSWALMVGGFGLVGGALRRRRVAFA